jgi:hypothetical protein
MHALRTTWLRVFKVKGCVLVKEEWQLCEAEPLSRRFHERYAMYQEIKVAHVVCKAWPALCWGGEHQKLEPRSHDR